jgi:hypothetical protein
LGSAVAVLDYNGDGNLDVLIGANNGGAAGGSYVDVRYGPITGDFTATGVNVRLNAALGAGFFPGDQILYGDINADGKSDLIITDFTNGDAYCLFGLN